MGGGCRLLLAGPTGLSAAADPSPRHTPAAAARSTPGSPPTTSADSTCSRQGVKLCRKPLFVRRPPVQSHGASHRAFSELDLKAVETELVQSRAVREDGLGKPVEVFSYPYGDAGANFEVVRDTLRRAGSRAACLY